MLTGGTDVHLVLVDLRNSAIDGKQAEDLLHEVGITVNRNAVPFDPRPPMVTSGLRIGTPGARDPRLRRRRVHRGRRHHRAGAACRTPTSPALRARVATLADAFPLYPGLTSPGLELIAGRCASTRVATGRRQGRT